MDYYCKNYTDFHPSHHFVGMVSRWNLLTEFIDHMKTRFTPELISFTQFTSNFKIAPYSSEVHIAYTICHGIHLAYDNLSDTSIRLMASNP